MTLASHIYGDAAETRLSLDGVESVGYLGCNGCTLQMEKPRTDAGPDSMEPMLTLANHRTNEPADGEFSSASLTAVAWTCDLFPLYVMLHCTALM